MEAHDPASIGQENGQAVSRFDDKMLLVVVCP
jgi:hypothetical protein